MAVTEAVHRQLEATWTQWRKAITGIPAEHWATGDVDYLIPARHALHVVNTVDAYARDAQPESWSGLATEHLGREVDWEGTPAADLPSPRECLAYLDVVRERVRRWLSDLGDEGLLAPQVAFPWTGPNVLSRMIYAIRHSQDHVGTLNGELRRRGQPRFSWEA